MVIFITCFDFEGVSSPDRKSGLAALAVGLLRFVRLLRCEPAEGGILLVRDAIRKRRLGLGQLAAEVGGVVQLCHKSALHDCRSDQRRLPTFDDVSQATSVLVMFTDNQTFLRLRQNNKEPCAIKS